MGERREKMREEWQKNTCEYFFEKLFSPTLDRLLWSRNIISDIDVVINNVTYMTLIHLPFSMNATTKCMVDLNSREK